MVALIRGLFGFGGPVDMLTYAQRAAELETDGNPTWYAAARAALGHANYVAGDLNAAASVLPGAAYSEAAPALIRILCFATLSLTQAELGQVERSGSSAEGAMELSRPGAFMPCPLFPSHSPRSDKAKPPPATSRKRWWHSSTG